MDLFEVSKIIEKKIITTSIDDIENFFNDLGDSTFYTERDTNEEYGEAIDLYIYNSAFEANQFICEICKSEDGDFVIFIIDRGNIPFDFGGTYLDDLEDDLYEGRKSEPTTKDIIDGLLSVAKTEYLIEIEESQSNISILDDLALKHGFGALLNAEP